MTWPRIALHAIGGGVIGFAAAKLLPAPVVAAAAVAAMVWALITLRQIKKKQKQLEEIMARWK